MKTSLKRSTALFVLTLIFVMVMGSEPKKKALDRLKKDQESGKKALAEARSSAAVLAPTWYKERYKAAGWLNWEPAAETNADTISGRGFSSGWNNLNWLWGTLFHTNYYFYSPINANILLLGLIIYPLFIVIWITIDEKKKNPSKDLGECIGEGLAGMLVITPAVYLGIAILSFVIYLLIYFAVGLFSDAGYYVPFDLISFCFHSLTMLFLLFINVSLLFGGVGIIVPLPKPKVSPTASTIMIATVKTLFVGLLSGIGSTIGGWVTGLIILAISGGIMAVVHPSEQQQQQQP